MKSVSFIKPQDNFQSASVIILQCVVPFFTGTDFNDILYAIDKDLAVTDMTGIEYFFCGFDNPLYRYLADDDLNLNLGQKVHFNRNTAIIFRCAFLHATAHNIGYRHTGNTDLRKCLTKLLKASLLHDDINLGKSETGITGHLGDRCTAQLNGNSFIRSNITGNLPVFIQSGNNAGTCFNRRHKVGVSRNTITRWAKDENWEMLRAAVTSTREEQIRNMYHQIAQINKSIAESESKYATSAQADAINKLASAISKLEGDYGIADIISVSKQMLTWMRRKDAAKAVEMSEWFDEFIKEKLR